MAGAIEDCTYAVIGGGIAGVTCAEHLGILDPEAKTVAITGSSVIKAVTNVFHLTKVLDIFDVEERPVEELNEQCPSATIVKTAVTRLDASSRLLYTSCGRVFHYKKLCICSGANPNIIARNSPHVLWIRDTESVQAFQERLCNAKRILIVGNGGIATEMVYEISGIEIIWAIKDNHITATFIDPGAAEFFKPELQKEKLQQSTLLKRRKYTAHVTKGKDVLMGSALGPDWHTGLDLSIGTERKITLERNVEVVDILTAEDLKKSGKVPTQLNADEGDWPAYVELTNGKIYGCNFVVSAAGVTPNTSPFLEGNNFKLGIDGGLLVNDRLQTSEDHIFAAGDVCTPGWDLALHWFQMRLWTQARQMGSYAAKCMWSSVSGEEMYMDFCFELFTHATKFYGYKVVLLGLFNGQKLDSKYEILLRMTRGMEYIKCVMVDGKMQGALLIGETGLEETFENLILNQMDLSIYGEELLDPNIDIEDYFD